MRMNMETFNGALDIRFFSTFSSGVNIWCRGRQSLITDMHKKYAEERLIYELKWKGLPSFDPNAQFLQTTGGCYITEENHWNSFDSLFSAIFSRKGNI